jgi:hypothetical protein
MVRSAVVRISASRRFASVWSARDGGHVGKRFDVWGGRASFVALALEGAKVRQMVNRHGILGQTRLPVRPPVANPKFTSIVPDPAGQSIASERSLTALFPMQERRKVNERERTGSPLDIH